MVFLLILRQLMMKIRRMLEKQINMFYEIIGDHTFKYIHCQNSAAMMYHHDTRSNLARIGIAMYGVDPAGDNVMH